MKHNINVFVLSLKNSKRLTRLKKRLKKLKIKYKVIYGINGREYYKSNKLDELVDFKKLYNTIGRKFSPSEIGGAASQLKIYKYIVKKKIDQAIIMEDDAYPSAQMAEWIKQKIQVKNNEVLGFYAYPGGFIEKKIKRKSLKNINIHKAAKHLYNCSCYQINKHTAKKILKITKGKVIGFADWPFNTIRDNISINITIPFMAIINDKGISYLKETRNKMFNNNLEKIKRILPKKVFKIISIIYYLSFLPMILGKYKNYNFYIEHFFLKSFYEVLNFFIEIHFNQRKLYFKENYYCNDLVKELRDVIKNQRYI